MEAFIFDVPNRPGELARVSAILGKHGVNIDTVAGFGAGEQGAFGLITSDEDTARAALDEAGISYRSCPCITVGAANQPGELDRLTRRLADVDINLEFIAPVELGHSATLALGVADPAAARAALGMN
ncbi:ACT domain-containing protein [Haloechinothrix sp. LS1_15]|uniref:ACT domain-containing protein n=1 Tax=Haloechinothrix sp. LS1_15 TaxID=2652248 RepID=UPI0029440F4C|nr:ACT domain-containing protein [Haloechinothrix sp. LS1_15]MDV6012870.1 ACT domain-containing protein [Haloechinothrix sp. LS1_15]